MRLPLRAGVPAVALAAVAAAAALWLAQPAGACACGVAIEATVHDEAALVVEEPGRERIVLSLGLSSDGDQRAAVVLPVPGEPTVEAIAQGDPIAYLAEATAPPPAVASGGGGETAAAPRVNVIGRETVGGYDVARLGSGDADALTKWLDDHGYVLPAGAEPILADYAAMDWYFVAIRLAPDSNGRLKPLDVAFATDEYTYPMQLEQLSTVPLNLTLFTLADGPREVDGLESTFDAPVEELAPPPPPELAELFAAGDWVTRLEAIGADPAQFTTDLLIDPVDEELEPGTTSAPAPTVETDEGDGGVSTGGVIALVCAGLAFAIGITLIMRPRRG